MMADEEEKGPFKTIVSILIAVTAVTAALVSWTTTRVNSQAGTFDGAATQAALDDASAQISIATDLSTNLYFYDQYAQHLETAGLLEEQAASTPSLSIVLEDERLREINRASFNQKRIEQDFLTRSATLDIFQIDRYRQTRIAESASQKDLDWASSASKADQVHEITLHMASLNLFFTAAIVLFTIGLELGRRRRLFSALLGGLLYLTGLSLFVAWMV